MRPVVAVSLSIALLLLLGARARAGDEKTKALEALSGDWRIKEIQGGKFDKVEKGKEPSLTFSGKEVVVKIAGMEETLKVELDPSKKPAHMDFTPTSDSDRTVVGIYKLEKDKLTICVSAGADKKRPDDFVLGGDSTRILVVLERVK
ncbi:MAG: TIGR03067 domain-containing protein [Gemmataceae bacterium]